jgi:hypothetical protein
LGVWKSDDAGDLLDFAVSEPHFEEPVTVNALTGEVQPTPGASRDAEGRISVQHLPVGKEPLLIKLATAPATTLYFVEGCTGEGFDEHLCLLSPDSRDATLRIFYLFAGGFPPLVRHETAPAHRRKTINVKGMVGRGREVSISVEVENGVPLVAERPMYFAPCTSTTWASGAGDTT